MVRNEVSREEASAILVVATLLVPQVSSGIIRLPIARLRITLRTAAPQSGVFMVINTMPALLITSAAAPAIKILRIPIRSYIRPASGLIIAVASEPGSVTKPEVTAEYPITLCTYSGIMTEEPIITR